MNILVFTAIIAGALHKIETADTVFDQTYQKVGNTRTTRAGLNRNLYNNYDRNGWIPPDRISATNSLTQRPFTTRRNGYGYNTLGNYGTNSLWNRPTPRPNYNKATTSSDDIDPAVAAAFPDLVNLLDRLKELNKLKDEGKLPYGPNKPDNPNNKPNSGNGGHSKPHNGNGGHLKPNSENGDHKNNGTTIKPNDKDDGINANIFPENNGNAVVIADGKVYFQAQPVVPENEREKINETIYYINSQH